MVYEYLCENCKHEWEETQKITDKAKKMCPKCKKKTAKRLISCSNFILKGGGWAKEGYSSK